MLQKHLKALIKCIVLLITAQLDSDVSCLKKLQLWREEAWV